MRCFYVLKKWSSAKLSLNRDLSLNKVSLNRDCTVLYSLNSEIFKCLVIKSLSFEKIPTYVHTITIYGPYLQIWVREFIFLATAKPIPLSTSQAVHSSLLSCHLLAQKCILHHPLKYMVSLYSHGLQLREDSI